MAFKISIRTRLFLSILLCLLPIQTVLIFSVVSRFDAFLKERITQNLDDGLNVVRTQFNSRLVEMGDVFQFPASSSDFKEHLAAKHTAWLEKMLPRWNAILPYVDIMAIFGADFKPLALRNILDVPPLSPFEPLLLKAKESRSVVNSVEVLTCELLDKGNSHIYCEEGDSSVLLAMSVIPVFADDGLFLGAIISADVINSDPFLRLQVESIFGRGVEAVITQGETPIVASSRSYEKQRHFRITPTIMTRLSQEGRFREEALIEGVSYHTAIEPLKNLAGAVVGTISVTMHDDDYRMMRKGNLSGIFWGLAVGTAWLFVMALYLARRFTNPIKNLVSGAERIGRGEFEQHTEVKTNDELEILAEAFNRMSRDLAERDRTISSNTIEVERANSRLSQLNEGLEKMVLQRTVELQREKLWLEAILSCLSEGLLVFDIQGQIRMVNPAARNILELATQEEINKVQVSNAMTERVHKHLEALRSGREDEPWEDELEMNGKRLKVNLTPLADVTGDLSGVIMSLQDVSMAATIDELKRDFISKVSHELKTPLTSIRGALHFLLEHSSEVGQAEQELLSVCYRNTERLMRLISDILTLSKMEAGKMTYHFLPQSIKQVAEQACEEIKSYAIEQGIELENRVASGFPLVCGDADRLIQVINNLLSNAIKFSPSETQVVITAQVRGEMAEISVTDEGKQIKWLDRDLLFKTFQQLDSPQSYRAGTGLGLAICKEIVEGHAGRIYYSPALPQGNRFAFTLPLAYQGEATKEAL
ncbi:MAG TPA: ATP-binding protein [Desulfuromonadaceae bacterium]|jgi:hypothetical protein